MISFLNLEYMCTPFLSLSVIFVSSVVVCGFNVTVMGYSGGSLGACACYEGVSRLILGSMLGSGMTGSSSASSFDWNSQGGSCGPGFCCCNQHSYALL